MRGDLRLVNPAGLESRLAAAAGTSSLPPPRRRRGAPAAEGKFLPQPLGRAARGHVGTTVALQGPVVRVMLRDDLRGKPVFISVGQSFPSRQRLGAVSGRTIAPRLPPCSRPGGGARGGRIRPPRPARWRAAGAEGRFAAAAGHALTARRGVQDAAASPTLAARPARNRARCRSGSASPPWPS